MHATVYDGIIITTSTERTPLRKKMGCNIETALAPKKNTFTRTPEKENGRNKKKPLPQKYTVDAFSPLAILIRCHNPRKQCGHPIVRSSTHQNFIFITSSITLAPSIHPSIVLPTSPYPLGQLGGVKGPRPTLMLLFSYPLGLLGGANVPALLRCHPFEILIFLKDSGSLWFSISIQLNGSSSSSS